MLWAHSSTRYLTDRNNHTCLFDSNSLCYKNNSISWAAFSKNDSKWLKSVMQSLAYIAMNAVKIVWIRSKSAPTDRCYPLSVSTTRFGFSKQEHFTFVSFHGQSLRPWRQAHDRIRKNIFTPSCSLLRSREISRTLSAILLMRWCRYRQTNDYDMRNLDGRKGWKAAVKDARMQRQSFFASLHSWMNSTNKRIVSLSRVSV